MTETKRFDAFFKFVSLLSSTRLVRPMELVAKRTHVFFVIVSLLKLRDFSQLFVVDVVEDEAELLIGLVEAADHSGIVEHLCSSFD